MSIRLAYRRHRRAVRTLSGTFSFPVLPNPVHAVTEFGASSSVRTDLPSAADAVAFADQVGNRKSQGIDCIGEMRWKTTTGNAAGALAASAAIDGSCE